MFEGVKMRKNPDRVKDKDCFLRFSKVEPLQMMGLFGFWGLWVARIVFKRFLGWDG